MSEMSIISLQKYIPVAYLVLLSLIIQPSVASTQQVCGER